MNPVTENAADVIQAEVDAFKACYKGKFTEVPSGRYKGRQAKIKHAYYDLHRTGPKRGLYVHLTVMSVRYPTEEMVSNTHDTDRYWHVSELKGLKL